MSIQLSSDSIALALDALDDIDAAQARSRTLYRYAKAAPYFWLWGAVWMLAYGLCDVFPGRSGLIWLVADGLGGIGSALLARRTFARGGGGAAWRLAGSGLALGAFIGATLAVMGPVSGRQISAFVPLVVACAYVMVGIWAGWRLVTVGLCVGALTLFGYFLVDPHFNAWMGGVGGSALMLTGWWMRRV